jgi:hypothetical protein
LSERPRSSFEVAMAVAPAAADDNGNDDSDHDGAEAFKSKPPKGGIIEKGDPPEGRLVADFDPIVPAVSLVVAVSRLIDMPSSSHSPYCDLVECKVGAIIAIITRGLDSH